MSDLIDRAENWLNGRTWKRAPVRPSSLSDSIPLVTDLIAEVKRLEAEVAEYGEEFTEMCHAANDDRDEVRTWKTRWQEAVRHADGAFAERDTANAILDEVLEVADEPAARRGDNHEWADGWDEAMRTIINVIRNQ